MASIILEKTGERIPVDESFFDLSEVEQQRQVDEFLFNREIEKTAPPAKQKIEGVNKVLNIGSKIAPYAGLAFKTTLPGIAASAALTGVSRLVEGKTEGESNVDALINAAKAAGIDLGTFGFGGVAGKIIKTKPVSSVLAQTGEVLSSVPKKSLQKAIQNPEILKESDTFENVGEAAREALQKQMSQVKKRATREKKILKDADKAIDLNTYANRQKALLNKKVGKQNKYTNDEKKQIRKFLNFIKKDNTPSGLNEIVSRIDDEINYNTVKPTPRVQKVLKDIRRKVSSKLKKEFDEYDESRQLQKQFLGEVNSILGSKLTNKKDASKLFKNRQELPTQRAIEKLDELTPESKLLDRAENIKIRDQLDRLFAGQGGGSGGAQGLGNLLRFSVPLVTGSSIGGPMGVALGAAAATATSPKSQKLAIQKSGKALSALSKLLAGSKGFTPIRENDGSYSEEFKAEIGGK